ncbi:uncharacterized protein DUF3822 [Chitinophaga skermanii]|uniref:Uncharacterized protein DUF3822 n=1 Tax=Chitinophaga skermanii TaxID=331697 RepID=A0A327QC68_9BACT|nr:DUF3822 family protein [Chitinophaga skermanii]RAJ02246.1 uncharacterized protein DUF3822 [Chitinophaga skermanii]
MAYTIQPAFAIDDDTLLETDLTTCHLLILIGSGTFNYAVFNPLHRKFLAVKSYSYVPKTLAVADLEMIEQIFDADKLLFTAFKEVLLAFDTQDNTLVPSEFFDPQLKKEYLHVVHPEKMHEAVLYDIVEEMGIVHVYAVDKDVLGFLRKEFSSDRVVHTNAALMKSYSKSADIHRFDGVAFIDIQAHQFVLTIFKNGKLLLQQQFFYQSGLDVVYYTINALRQLQLSEQQVKVKLGGALSNDSVIYTELNKFIPQMEWIDRPSGILYLPKMQELPSHHFQNLYALALCV